MATPKEIVGWGIVSMVAVGVLLLTPGCSGTQKMVDSAPGRTACKAVKASAKVCPDVCKGLETAASMCKGATEEEEGEPGEVD